ncbi:enolase 4-like isoform X1 [Saccostrea echinata]|uniref:enolase 4-like isoform X1 n=1 Tax=Saccostrea echinata TaxID=191078 RepID=UPI002A7F7A74|nr:enolase 4-like isoform X1 [Saccostrea echinata]
MASASSTAEARERYELKQRAVKYYDQNGVPKKMEEVLNSMFYDNPNDVYGHLANYFAEFAKTPLISQVSARHGFDSKGQTTIQADMYCTLRNNKKLAATVLNSSTNSSLPENTKPEEREEEDKSREASVEAAIALLNGDINNRLQGVDPALQSDVDNILTKLYEELKAEEEERLAKEAAELAASGGDRATPVKEEDTASTSGKKGGKSSAKKGKSAPVVVIPDEPKEKLLPGAGSLCVASRAACTAAATVRDVPLYQHIAALRFGEIPKDMRIPIPMVTIIQSGRSAPGKLNCVKEFMVVPKPGMPISESLRYCQKIYSYVTKNFVNKSGMAAQYGNDIGALCPSYDKPEQGLDILQDAITSLELTPGEDFFIALNLAGKEIFDYDPSIPAKSDFPGQGMHKEKGKYEVMGGQQKVPEDMVEFWAELLGRYPSVIAIIDPLRKQEKEHWMRLCERISDQCYVMGNHTYPRPAKLLEEELTEEFKTSGIILKMDQLNTVTDVLDCAKKMEDAENQIVLTTCYGETTDTFLADMAVGMNARFFKIGAPVRGERIALFNRLIQIESQLKLEGKLAYHGENVFPHIAPPPIPEPEEGEEAQEEEKKDDKTKKK